MNYGNFLEILSIITQILSLAFLCISIVNIVIQSFVKKESTSIKQETEDIVNQIQNQPDYDVFKLLYKNVRESTEYYIISKRQANKSFSLALISCFLGVIIYICGFFIVAFFDQDIAILTTISGSIVELIAGLSFWVYNKCVKQLNEYHKRLNSTEKYLTSIQMADRLNETERAEMYKWLIQNVMIYDLDRNSIEIKDEQTAI